MTVAKTGHADFADWLHETLNTNSTTVSPAQLEPQATLRENRLRADGYTSSRLQILHIIKQPVTWASNKEGHLA